MAFGTPASASAADRASCKSSKMGGCPLPVVTATPLTNHGTIVSLPHRNVPSSALPGGIEVDEAARRVRDGAAHTHPRLPTAIGHCMYVRRSALELVGPFDLAFSPGYGEEVDFSQRCVLTGLA